MSDWYYAEGERQHGPVASEELAARFRDGRLAPGALVWREGMDGWRPLGELAAELGLTEPGTSVAGASVAGPAAAEPASPYAAPLASMPAQAAPVNGGEIVFAGFWKRFAALFIDSFILGAVTMVLMVIGMLLAGGASVFSPQAIAEDVARGTLGLTFILFAYVVPIFVQAAYATWMQASGTQATLGKMAVGIKVARGNGEALTLGRSFGRWCAYFFLNLVTCGVGTLVSAFTAGLTARKQALHDMLADTLVVDKWAYTAHPERQQRQLGTVTWVIIVLAGLFAIAYIGFLVFAIGMGAALNR